jgi:hypothetical protein
MKAGPVSEERGWKNLRRQEEQQTRAIWNPQRICSVEFEPEILAIQNGPALTVQPS